MTGRSNQQKSAMNARVNTAKSLLAREYERYDRSSTACGGGVMLYLLPLKTEGVEKLNWQAGDARSPSKRRIARRERVQLRALGFSLAA